MRHPLATVALINFLEEENCIDKNMMIWEPACGSGAICEIFKNRGYNIIGTDLNQFGYGDPYINFLETDISCDWIITNPPFSKATAFIEHALSLNKPCAFLLKSQFWHAKSRLKLFESNPPSYVLPLTWRPDFLFGKKSGSPTMEVIWTVWTWNKETRYIPLPKPELGQSCGSL